MTRTQPALRPATPADELLLTELLAGLSPASAFHRFMAGLGRPKPSLVRGLLRTDPRRGAVLALEHDADGTEHALGHACWSVDGNGVADLGVVVADRAQGLGLGRALFEAALRSAAEAGATAVHLDVHPDNRRVAGIVRGRLGARALAFDDGLLTLDAPLLDAVRTRPVALAA
jgi:ribosomal protein S18 acetylase RimI-like enzyme